MAKSKRASPGVNRNLPNTPEPDAILRALAAEMADQGALIAIRERRKEHRKAAELEGVNLKELDDLYKSRDMTAEEIEAAFRRKWAHFAAVFTSLSDQLDLFVAKAAPETRAAYGHAGRMAGLAGKACEPPDGLVGEPLQEWLGGWHSAASARSTAMQDLSASLLKAIAIADEGGVVDGTGDEVKAVEPKKGKAKAGSARAKADSVRLQAADDFEADQNPLVVGGVQYATEEGAAEARAKIAALRGHVGEPTEEERSFH